MQILGLQVMKRTSRFIFGCMLGLLALTDAYASWVYKGPTPEYSAIEISKELGRVSIGDRGYSATFCAATDNPCFRSEALSFAAPSRFRLNEQWDDTGQRFQIVGSKKMAIAGRTTHVFLIQHRANGAKLLFLYSPVYGLVGIAEMREKSVTLTVEGGCGFPMESCTSK